jgi:hypothetical protein
LLTNGDKKLVHGHGRVDGYFASEESFNAMLLNIDESSSLETI